MDRQICFIQFYEVLLYCLGFIVFFDSGYNVCISLLLWVNVFNVYINIFWRFLVFLSLREGRMCEKNFGIKNYY